MGPLSGMRSQVDLQCRGPRVEFAANAARVALLAAAAAALRTRRELLAFGAHAVRTARRLRLIRRRLRPLPSRLQVDALRYSHR